MKTIRSALLTLAMLAATAAPAGDLTTDAAIGGALGGVVGAEVGGRSGAVLGAGVGAATGAAIGTRGDAPRDGGTRVLVVPSDRGHSHGHFCPPGQARKGRC